MKKRRARKWSDEQLKVAVASSKNLSDVLRHLNLRVAGGNHKSIKFWIDEFKLDTSHFCCDKQLSRLQQRFEWNQSDVLCESSSASRNTVKRWARKLIPYVCECGNNGTHRGKSLTLQLDHINGVGDDHRVENLRWMCPNCHSQTDTFAGKKSFCNGERYGKKCIDCDVKIGATRIRCKPCDVLRRKLPKVNTRKVERPSKEELSGILSQYNFCEVGRMYGVTDNAIRKWAKSYELM